MYNDCILSTDQSSSGCRDLSSLSSEPCHCHSNVSKCRPLICIDIASLVSTSVMHRLSSVSAPNPSQTGVSIINAALRLPRIHEGDVILFALIYFLRTMVGTLGILWDVSCFAGRRSLNFLYCCGDNDPFYFAIQKLVWILSEQ